MVARCLCLMGNKRVVLPHAAISHRLTVQYHPEINLWTPTQGTPFEVDVYGWYGRRNGLVHWQTDLVQPSEPDIELSDAMTGKEIRSLCDALTYNLQWRVEHIRPQSRRGFTGQFDEAGEVTPGELIIRKIGSDVISQKET